MEEFEKLESLIDKGASYAHVRIDEAKLALAEKSTNLISFLIVRATILLVFLICLLFLSAAAAIVIGDRMGAEWEGFLVIGTAYFLLGWLTVATKEKLIRLPIMNALIRQIFKNDE